MDTEQTHAITVTEHQEDCGEVWYAVQCTCGYQGEERPGQGCWQQNHNQYSYLDTVHDPLLADRMIADAATVGR